MSAQKLSPQHTGFYIIQKEFFKKQMVPALCAGFLFLSGLRLTMHVEHSFHFSLPLHIILFSIKPYSKLAYFPD